MYGKILTRIAKAKKGLSKWNCQAFTMKGVRPIKVDKKREVRVSFLVKSLMRRRLERDKIAIAMSWLMGEMSKIVMLR